MNLELPIAIANWNINIIIMLHAAYEFLFDSNSMSIANNIGLGFIGRYCRSCIAEYQYINII